MQITLGICLLSMAAMCPAADLRQIQEIYQGILHSGSDSRLPKASEPGIADSLKALTEEEAKSLMPLAQQCLQSARSGVRGEGTALLFAIMLRPDSTKVFEPYVDDLAALLTGREPALREVAVMLLGGTWPVASPRAIAYLIAHLTDKNNSAGELRITAAAVLKATAIFGGVASKPPDAATIHRVLASVEQHPEFKLRGDVSSMLGLYRITNDEALKFIRSALNDPDRSFREDCLEGLDHMPREVRARFIPDLQRIEGDPTESQEVRSRATALLKSQQ